MNSATEWLLGIVLIATPFYLIYLMDKHGPERGTLSLSRMKVTTKQRTVAKVVGTSILAAVVWLTVREGYVPFVVAVYLSIAIALLAYGFGGRKLLRYIPGWGQYYRDKTAKDYFEWANTLLQNRSWEGAIADYTEVIRLKPNFADAYLCRGNARENIGDLDGAIADYSEAIRLEPQRAAAYTNRGILWMLKGETKKAFTDYSDAVRFEPQYVLAYLNRGIASQSIGLLKEAIVDYTTAIRLDSGLTETYLNRGHARLESGDSDGTITDIEKFLDLTEGLNHPSRPSAADLLKRLRERNPYR